MANDDRLNSKVKDDRNTKSKKKNVSPASISGPADASGLRRSGRETPSRKQATESPSTRKSERIEKQAPASTPPTKKKSERTEKQTEKSPLRRSDRGKKHLSPGSAEPMKLVEVSASPNGKSENKKRRKGMTALSYKALFKPQRIRIEADVDRDQEGQDKSSHSNTSRDGDVDMELKSPDKLPRLDDNKSRYSLEDKDGVVGKCSDEVGEKCFQETDERPCGTSYSSLKNFNVKEVDDQSVIGESDCRRRIDFTEGHEVSLNSRRVEGTPDKAQKPLLDERLMDPDQVEDGGCPPQTKPLDGKFTECGDAEKQIGGKCSPSDRINHDLENQQELDSGDKACDRDLHGSSSSKVRGTHKAVDVMENAENNDAATLLRKDTSSHSERSDSFKFVEFWVPVQISNVQLEQYCATLLSSDMVLRSCSKSDTVGALHNILNSNRKCCDHPYIVDPNLQKSIMKGLEPTMLLEVGIKASGKLHFLDLILPEIKKRKLRVVILFQPTVGIGRGYASVGDILDDFIHQRFGQDSYERLDGVGIVPSKKQAALNNFNKDMSRFIFLLENRVHQKSIKLSSVDIIFIFDGDLNPANDLKVLQKVSIDTQSEQLMIFRLYSSYTLEEKILRLAEQNVAIDSKLQYLNRSNYDALLMWGASDLFKKLTEFHSSPVLNISSEESFLKDVVEEFLYLLSHKCKSKDTAKQIITRIQSCGTYGKNLPGHNDSKTQFLCGEQPQIFWKNLLEGRHPQWKFVSVSTARQRKRPHYFGDSSKVASAADADVGKKRKKTLNNSFEPAAPKPIIEVETGGANEGASGVPAHNESQASSGDRFWSTADAICNETSLHDLLKPTVSELCEVLKFSEDLKIMVESFLKFVLENYQVSKEHKSTLQAFMISLCWIGSSLSKYKIDRRESFALAKKHLNFSCQEEEANSVYSKLEPAKEMFLRHTENQEKCDALKDCMPSENHDEEALQSTEQMPNKCKNQKEGTDQKESEMVNSGWDEKRALLENDYKLEKALVRTLHSNPWVRAEKLRSLEQEFANKLKEHERKREIQLKDPKATLLGGEGQMATNRVSSDATPTSSRNLVEVQSHVHEMVVPADNNVTIPNVMVGRSIQTEPLNSPESTDGGRDKVNAVSLELVGSRIKDQPKQGGTLDTGTNHVETNDVTFVEVPGTTIEPCNKVGNSPNIESTGSHTSEKQVSDAAVSSVRMGENPAEHDGNDKNVAGHVHSGVPEVDSNQENAKEGTSSPVVSHAVEDRNETAPSGIAEMGMPVGNCSKDNGECPDASHAEDHNGSCGSSSSNSPPAAALQDKTPLVEPVASPVSDHSMPTVQGIQNESLQSQQLPDDGIQAHIDVDNVQPVDAGRVGQINTEDSCDPHDELSFRLSTHLMIAEDQSGILPSSGLLLETTCEEPTLTCAPANPSDYSMLQSRGNLEGEHQPHLPSSEALLEQPNLELDNSQNPETPSPSLNAEIPNQNALQSQLNMFDVQGSGNHNQVASRVPKQADPLQAELERLCAVKENVIKSHEDTKQRLKSECEKEIAEMIAQIRLKYEAKHQESETAFQSKKKELDNNLNRVVMNKILAEAFRSKCQDVSASGKSGIRQATQAGVMQVMQQLHKSSAQPSMNRSPSIPPPPLQIVNRPAALFSSRPPLNINPSTTPPPSINPSTTPPPSINPSTTLTPSRPALNINPSTTPTPSRPALSINPSTTPTPSRPALNINPSTTVSRGNPSTMPNRPPPNINSITPCAGIRPISVGGEMRAPAPHIRPFRPDFTSYRMLPSQQVTGSLTPSAQTPAPEAAPVCLSDDD